MPDYARPILIHQPRRFEFGAGTAEAVGLWADAEGFRRILVVSDAFNADRVDRLGLRGSVTVFGAVKPEPDTINLEAALSRAAVAEPDS